MTILKSVTVGVTASGSNGSASGNADSASFLGSIEAIEVNYASDCPNTADVTITSKRSGVTIWTLNNASTDRYAIPVLGAVLANDAAVLVATANGILAKPYIVDQGVNVAVAQANSATNQVVVTIHYRK